jgi:hypothetical protein
VLEHRKGTSKDGLHVNGTAGFCHVVLGFLSRSTAPTRRFWTTPPFVIMQIALLQKAIIANCKTSARQNKCKALI